MKIHLKILLILLFCFNKSFSQTEIPFRAIDSLNIKQYTQNAQLNEQQGDKKEASRFYDLLALLYWEHNFYRKAVDFFDISLKLNEKLDNLSGISMINNNLAMIYSDMNDFNKSVEFFNKTLVYRRSVKEKVGIISALVNMSVVLNNLKRFPEAIKNLEEALDIARQMNDVEQMKSCYGMMSESYEKAGDQTKSSYYFNLYRTFHEKIQADRDENSKKSVEQANLLLKLTEAENKNKELEMKFTETQLKEKEQDLQQSDAQNQSLIKNLTKRELQIELLNREAKIKDLQAKDERSKREREQLRFRFLSVILIFVFIALFVVYFLLKQMQKANKQLAKQNDEINSQKLKIMVQKADLEVALLEIDHKSRQITDSINYALRIQQAMMQRQYTFNSMFSDSFIMYLPKAIVSGDFYWYLKTEQYTIAAAVDCTGHGVPGAFMSMVGINLLNQIVENNQIYMPNEILYHLHRGIHSALNQELTSNRDGMDISICVFDLEKKLLHFAGAMNPLFIVQNGEIQHIKADSKGIGGLQFKEEKERVFCMQTIEINGDECFYMFSDGYVDQFGGEHNRKFMLNRFKKMLLDNYTKPMAEQLDIFEKTFHSWKGKRNQIDDIMVVGIKV